MLWISHGKFTAVTSMFLHHHVVCTTVTLYQSYIVHAYMLVGAVYVG